MLTVANVPNADPLRIDPADISAYAAVSSGPVVFTRVFSKSSNCYDVRETVAELDDMMGRVP